MSTARTDSPGRVDLAMSPLSGGKTEICSVYVGTCGYSYTEWVDSGFYPPGTRSNEMVGLYGRCFSVVELNYTWYQMARADILERMVAGSPSHLLFCAKLTRTMTHERDDNWRHQLVQYRDGIAPLVKAGRLAAVLVQFPPGFERTIANRTYLAALLDGLHGLPVAVEFRHVSWLADSVFSELGRRRVTLVAVDVPALAELFPSLDVVTNPQLFYVRFHGRNQEGWRSGNMQKKFAYDYCREELASWSAQYLVPMARRSGRGLVFFNNHVRARAPHNGMLLQRILQQHGHFTAAGKELPPGEGLYG
ncbi:DUF72 domain-containing protein [Desulforhopalus singaporensis]|uniref:Uncharacterized conserved protein YecE, DUF72 family n=1 Tax=Desulforhopalus singaporensis TaxID=91360 RepID=A0A1H0M3F9_9BACT|nr:DUF72 domain-containing protein [Desulforhopalus singaporensis]SDO75012.1 Uncharacterized conserved protein YecE, DUF72 family [Desulforhopalus singaporensis]